MTLGRLGLATAPGGDLADLDPHRQKLALLTVLALSRRAMSRDELIGLFWADQEEARARHSLSNALSYLRSILGRHAIRPHRDEVRLEPGTLAEVDAEHFADLVARESWEVALAVYGGPFLQGVYVGGAAAFQQWVDGERNRLEGLFLKACAGRTAELAEAGRWEECAGLAKRWLEASPLSTEAAVTLLDALAAPGTRDAGQRALEAYDQLGARLREEFGRRPSREVMERARAVVARLRETDATGEFPVPSWVAEGGDPEVPVAGAPVAPAAAPPLVPFSIPAPARVGRRWFAIGGGVAVVVALLAWLVTTRGARSAQTAPEGRPVVAVGAIRAPGDTASAWLQDGLVQMISARLARSSGVEVVAPERMRELMPSGGSLSELLAAGRRAGARWAVSGGVTRAEHGLVMDVNVHDVRDGRLASLTTVTAPDAIALADRVAVQVLSAAGGTAEGPALAEVETASPEAYEHFIRYLRASDERRDTDALAALDAAIALDSGFVSALRERAVQAFLKGEHQVLAALLDAFRRNQHRATEFDRLFIASQTAFYNAEHDRAESLARQLAERYPRDPRALTWLHEVTLAHGRWAESEAALLRLLALDSLAARTSTGACVPCNALGRLAELRLARGNLTGAEAAARRFTEIAPEVAQPWRQLSVTLAAQGKFEAALEAVDRVGAIAPGSASWMRQRGQVLIFMRRWAEADSFIRMLRRTAGPSELSVAFDLRAILDREQGRFLESVAVLDSMKRMTGSSLDLVAGSSLARAGRYDSAVPRFVAEVPQPSPIWSGLRSASGIGDLARAWSWHRALEADAVAAPTGDTLRLHRIADSLVLLSPSSYYGRDWRLQHHVRGLLLARAGRHEEAVAAFEAAEWSSTGWNRTLAERARSELALGRSAEALATLRRAYIVELDAMGRYQPRSELDSLMAEALSQAGLADSAAIYRAYFAQSRGR